MGSGPAGDCLGRAGELATIEAAMASGVLRAVVLVGDMGVGKTHLARTAVAAAAQTGRRHFWVGGSASTPLVPFGAVLQLIPDRDYGDRYRLLRKTSAWLKELEGNDTPVIGVDDAHLLDEASATLIHHLAQTESAFIVATVRNHEPAPEAVTALWKDGTGTRLDVGPLSREGTLELLRSLVAGHPDPMAETKVWHVSGGNALYVCELMRAATENREIEAENGVWRWKGPLAPTPRLAELVARRLQGQSEHVRRLVDLVAFGEPLAITTLEAAGFTADVIESAEQAGLIRSQSLRGATELRMGHPFLGEVAGSLSSPLAQTRMARLLLRAEQSTAEPKWVTRLALWQLASGTVPDPGLLGRGALRALAALDLEVAERLARGAVETGGGAESAAVLARVMILRGKAREADELLQTLETEELPASLQAEVAASRAWNLTFGLQRPDDAENVLQQAWDSREEGRDVIAAQWANILCYAGMPDRALAMAKQALDDPAAQASARVKAMTSRCEALAVQGKVADAVAAGQTACRLSSEMLHGDWAMSQDEAEGALVGALIQNGDLDTAGTMIELAYARAVEAGWRVGAGMWSVWRGDLCLARGLPATALAHFRRGLAVAIDEPHPYLEWMRRFAWSHLSQAAALTGDVALGAAALSSADAHARPWLGALDVWGGSAHAWLAVARGEVDRGTRLALAAAQRARRDHQSGWEMEALHQVVRFGRPRQALTRLGELARTGNGAMSGLYIAHAAALAAGNGEELDRIAAAFRHHGYTLLAAEVAASAAHAFGALGQGAAAAASRGRACEWASRCEGARTPALRRLGGANDLTPREREISRLAAGGLSNRQIADQLLVSVRTVENILHHVYEKLSIPGRQGLTDIFAPQPYTG